MKVILIGNSCTEWRFYFAFNFACYQPIPLFILNWHIDMVHSKNITKKKKSKFFEIYPCISLHEYSFYTSMWNVWLNRMFNRLCLHTNVYLNVFFFKRIKNSGLVNIISNKTEKKNENDIIICIFRVIWLCTLRYYFNKDDIRRFIQSNIFIFVNMFVDLPSF